MKLSTPSGGEPLTKLSPVAAVEPPTDMAGVVVAAA